MVSFPGTVKAMLNVLLVLIRRGTSDRDESAKGVFSIGNDRT